VQKKITDLKRKLSKIETSRTIQRGGRDGMFKVALVGYTNVGKSSLLNTLCGSSVLVENKLFATLDTATRRAYIPGAGTVIISDTVGLLRKLPHHLVASFHSTLSEVSEAHLLLLVMDASSSWIEQQLATVEQVLDDLEASKIARLVVFNKIDLVDDPFIRKRLSIAWPNALFVNAFNKDDISTIKGAIAEAVQHYTNERRKNHLIIHTTKNYLHHDTVS
jgi:GTP-binding protein HflX